MKVMRLHLLMLCMCIGLLSDAQTGTEFFFGEAQPKNSYNLEAFPAHFHGIYTSAKDSLLRLVIRDSVILSRANILYSTTRDKVESRAGVFVQNGEIHGLAKNKSFPIVEENDTIYFFYQQESVLFQVGSEHLLREHGQRLYLNFFEGGHFWTSLLLEFDGKGQLLMKDIDFELEQEQLSSFEAMKVEDEKIVARPIRKELQTFAEGSGFSSVETYSRSIAFK